MFYKKYLYSLTPCTLYTKCSYISTTYSQRMWGINMTDTSNQITTTTMATTILDIPFYCLPFFLLVQLTTLSKECYTRGKEALYHKDRGGELFKYFASMDYQVREYKIDHYLCALDTWHMWFYLSNRLFGSCQTSFVFLKAAPCAIDICTTHRNNVFHIEVSGQQSMDILAPYLLFGNIANLIQPSVDKLVSFIDNIMKDMMGVSSSTSSLYDDIWWRTSPLTFYEVDLAHNVYYQFADVVITSVNSDVQISIPYRRTRVAASTVRNHLAILADFVTHD
jgi:hypothetical protein